jgi:hypothetical protein
MPFKSKAQARAMFGGYIKGMGKKDAKEWAGKTNFSKIPDHVKESLELGTAKKKPEATDGLKSPKPEVKTGNTPVQNPEVVQAKESLELGTAKKKPEVTDGLKSPSPEVLTGNKPVQSPEVTQAKESLELGKAKVKPEQTDGLKSPKPETMTGNKPVQNPEVTQAKESLELGIAKKKPETTDGLKSPSPEVLTGNKPVQNPEQTQAKLAEELEKGEAKVKPEETDGLKSPKPEVTDGMPSDGHPQVTQAEEMDEASKAKHKALQDKVKALEEERKNLEKEMEETKQLGIKKHIHATKREEVAKLGEEIKKIKEAKKAQPIRPGHSEDDREGNKHMPKAGFTIPSKKWKVTKKKNGKENRKKGWDKDFQESVQVLSESFSNAYVRKMSQQNLISERVLNNYWEEAVKLQETNGEISNKSQKAFWYGVVKNFNEMLNEDELKKAKAIMTERERFTMNTEKFVNCLAKDDYTNAGQFMSEMVEASLANLIDVQKVQYQKEMGEKVAKNIRGA